MISDYGEEYMPRRSTIASCGYDFYSPDGELVIHPGKVYGLDTGIHLEYGDLKESEVMILVPRSSLGFKYGFRFTNTIGVIDSDYRDSIKASFTVDKTLIVNKGDRLFQGIILQYGIIPGEIPPTQERNGGIGSTGN